MTKKINTKWIARSTGADADTETKIRVAFRHTDVSLLTSAAKMPSSCWGKYRNVGVVEHLRTRPPSIMHQGASVIRYPYYAGRCHSGSNGGNNAFDRAYREAQRVYRELAGPTASPHT